ncbi:hypothetical protein ILYODFUR_009726 [Ilyodon furcidens]|uniref:Uncharacterized protein n=1 Tax=Ilyodon furcidens TaxID=33524 RepID=A0ABV0T6R8_9TELE
MLYHCQKSLSFKPPVHRDKNHLHCISHIHYVALSGTCLELKSLNDARECQRAPRVGLCKCQCPSPCLLQQQRGGKGEKGTERRTRLKMKVERLMGNMVTVENAITYLTVASTAEGERKTRSNFTHHYFHAD